MVTILFWTLFVILAFTIALALQMRVLVSLVLRRALAAKFGGDPGMPAYRAAIGMPRTGIADSPERRHLMEVYPRALAHLSLARRASVAAPLLLLALVVARRLAQGGG